MQQGKPSRRQNREIAGESMYRETTIGVVVPAYNEEGYVGSVIENLPEYVDRAYVIDDGSTDGTWDEITRHAKRANRSYDGAFEKRIVPIRHDTNRGVGGAIKTGYLHAREDEIEVTAVLGGDDQMNPAELTNYIDPIIDGEGEYAKGNRFTRAEHWEAMPRFRLVGNVMLSYLTKVASGYWELMDSQNGYTAISLAALEKTDIEGMYEYYGYCNDLLVRLNTADVTVVDVPRSSEYAYEDGWKSHIDYSEYIPRVSAMLLRSFTRRLTHKYLLTGYNPLVWLYAVGTAIVTIGLLGLVRSLIDDEGGETATWILTTAVGLFSILGATERDREANEQLQLLVEPEKLPAEEADRQRAKETIDGLAPVSSDD